MLSPNKLLLFLVLVAFTLLSSTDAFYNVVSFGARPDGRTDSTRAFLTAWNAACRSVRPMTVYVPRGTFLVKQVTFSGPCRSRVVFEIDGTIVAPADYWSFYRTGFWFLFRQVSGLIIHGGVFDAKGSGFWACRRRGSNCPPGVRSITIQWCNDVVVSSLTSINSQIIHIAIDQSSKVRFQNVKIRAPSRSPNTDGINIQHSTGVTISSTIIQTGDDCISIGPGSKNIWMEKIGCGPGHGISVGSLGNGFNEDGVQNVTVTNSVFTKTENGVRIKSWARASNSYATNIVFQNIIMRNVGNPMIIDQTYCPDNQCPHQSSGVRVSQVTYRNIKGTSSTPAAITFQCNPSSPCRGIRLQDIKLTTPNKPTFASCSNAIGYSVGSVTPRSCLRR